MDKPPTVAFEVVNQLTLREISKDNINGNIYDADKEMKTIDDEVTTPVIGLGWQFRPVSGGCQQNSVPAIFFL